MVLGWCKGGVMGWREVRKGGGGGWGDGGVREE